MRQCQGGNFLEQGFTCINNTNKNTIFSAAVVCFFLTFRVGLIEWMNNTKPFKEVLQNAMTKNEHEHYVGK